MGDELDINIIKATQNSLGKYVKRPPLSDKLLRKPPFRFLHDIITSVLKSTGFFEGLFEDGELVSENVKDRESKILFLGKIITVVSSTTGKPLTVKASKIIAGQEPEKTNELLQCIALALEKNLSSNEAVKQYKSSSAKPTAIEKKNKEVKKIAKKGVDLKVTSKNEDKTSRNDNSNNSVKVRSKESLKKESPPKKYSQASKAALKKTSEKPKQQNKEFESSIDVNETLESNCSNSELIEDTQTIEDSKSSIDLETNRFNTNENIEDGDNKLNSLSSAGLIASHQEVIPEPQHNEESNVSHEGDNTHTINNKDKLNNITAGSINNVNNIEENNGSANNVSDDFKNIADVYTPISDLNSHESKNIESSKITRPLSVRPSSSRPGAPRIRDKHEDTITESDNLLIGKVNIIVENTVQEEDEDSSIIIVEEPAASPKLYVGQGDESSKEHGHLVQQILNSQKEFSQASNKTEIEWQFGAKKARDVINQEIDQLRFNVQALSRVANPLGKLLDHIQEDVEVMRQELQQWSQTYEQASRELIKQKATNEELLLPFHSKLKQLDADINEKHDKINDLKIIIHKNAHRIDRLLANGNIQ